MREDLSDVWLDLKGENSTRSSSCISLFQTVGWFSSICLQGHLWLSEEGRSTNSDLREGTYVLLCSLFYPWRYSRKPLLKWESMADLSSSLGHKRS